MNDYDKIKGGIKISDFLQKQGIHLISVGDEKFRTHCINPEHEDSNPSLEISDTLRYAKCFSCGYGGDIFNLLETLHPDLTGRKAIEYFYSDYQLKNTTLQHNGIQIPKVHNIQDETVFQKIMQDIGEYWSEQLDRSLQDKYLTHNENKVYISNNGQILFMQGWGLSYDIIQEYKLGYSPNNKELFNVLSEKYNSEDIARTGLFNKKGLPNFKNCIVIPYISKNNIVYFIARQTELTPSNKFESGKYKNQKTQNKYLYNEEDIDEQCLFITEGSFDTLALKMRGYYAIGLGGIQNTQRLMQHKEKLKNKVLLYICFDNDGGEDGAGNKEALKFQSQLLKYGIESQVIILPLEGRKKMDVCEYFATHTKAEFNRLIFPK